MDTQICACDKLHQSKCIHTEMSINKNREILSAAFHHKPWGEHVEAEVEERIYGWMTVTIASALKPIS